MAQASTAELAQTIEELAVQTVLIGAAGPGQTDSWRLLGEVLAKIRACAEVEESPEVGIVAAELEQMLDHTPDDGPAGDLGLRIEEGVARMRQAIEAANSPRNQTPPLALGEDPELLTDFALEARDHLVSIEQQLLTLEQDAENPEAIHSVFRSFHTIKGLAGFLDLVAIQEVSHEVETVLDKARNHQIAITPPVIDVVLESADYLKQSIARLERMLAGGNPQAESDNRGLIGRIRTLPEKGDVAGDMGPVGDEQVRQQLVGLSLAMPPVEEPAGSLSTPAKQTGEASSALAVKVDTSKLDFLIEMVGEMVVAQSLVRHDPDLSAAAKPRLARNLSQLARMTEEVQKTAMSMRMVPVGQLFQRMARLVRDLNRKSGKQAELEIAGEQTELDRTIVEGLSDPLMHMVRNAADHGIETPAERSAAGKPAAARIRLAASHQAGHILIEVSDDGRGLIREKILRKARQNGLVEDGSELSEQEVFRLIFEPGFSTAEQVTDVSGRGVGMDVVKKQIQKLRGRIDIESEPGRGTRFLLRLPLTLAIIDGLVVGVGEERYIAPLFAVREMLRPSDDMISTVQGRSEMALVRGSLLPIIRLYQKFGSRPRSERPEESLLIVSESAGKPYCLMVDELFGKQEIVIKSLGESFGDVGGVAGCAILGDGRVGLILDMDGLFRVPSHG